MLGRGKTKQTEYKTPKKQRDECATYYLKNKEKIIEKIGAANAHKVVYSDFKPGFFFDDGWTQASVIEYMINEAKELRMNLWQQVPSYSLKIAYA